MRVFNVDTVQDKIRTVFSAVRLKKLIFFQHCQLPIAIFNHFYETIFSTGPDKQRK